MDRSFLRSRIVAYAEVSPATLAANPDNFNVHPPEQHATMQGLLTQVGWVADLLVSQRTGRLLDGHLRLELALREGHATVPVAYVDLEPDEERKALLYLNRTTSLAQIDAGTLQEALALIGTVGDQAVDQMLHDYASVAGLIVDPPAQLTSGETALEPSQNTMVRVGDLKFLVSRAQYLSWLEAMRLSVSFNAMDINAEILRRLGLTS